TAPPLHAQQASYDASGPSAEASAAPVAHATRTDDPPVIDGVPSEAAWSTAAPLDAFIQRVPRDGQVATEDTDIRVLFDGDAIYVGVWAWERHEGQIVPGEAIRDFEVTDADAVVMIFDTFNDEQNGFVFGTTPAGIEYDGQVAAAGSGGGFFLGGGSNSSQRFQAGAGGGFNKNWDGSWTVATSQDARGWYAEFRIPFTTLRYTSGDSEWGFNVTRRVRHLNEEAFWSEIPREFNLYRLDFAGALQIAPPTRLSGTATPYVLGATARDYATGEAEFGRDGEIGGEAKLQITQGLTADLTVNTDFAQVEVDDAQVNLTRFPLLFPEKRPFFLENAGFFTVGGGGADLFFSRRIGIDAGTPVPIKGGGRVSGRAAGLNVGGLYIQTQGFPDIADQGRNAYGVARVAKELPGRSKIGALFTDRRSDIAGDDSQTYAVDGQLGLGDAVNVTSYLARTAAPGRTGDDVAWNVTSEVTTRAFRGNVTVQQIGEDFNPEIGFVPRRGHRYYQVFGMYNIRPNRVFRELRPHISYFTFRNTFEGRANRGFEISSRLHIDNHWEWDSGMELHTGTNWVREGLYEPFEIRGVTDDEGNSIVVPTGLYDGWEAALVFFTDQSRTLSFNSRFNWGAFLSGSKRTSSADVTFRSGDRSSATISAQYNDVELPEGDFTTLLTSLRLGYFFTPRLYLQGLVQYSDQVDRWSTNLRLGWLDTAGTGLFIVYNDVQGFDTLQGPQARSLIIKYTRQFDLFGM
ncbi:MAG: carbohydrate binding family 9 domain-containing protein, partial [Gemmatimonadetes bacterium]|nr:carbohydrate binding family 9 domain-containing protein [Gemmatimonadota bacterium]